MVPSQSLLYALLASPVLYLAWSRLFKSRTSVIPRSQERVLILGASSGIGRCLALQYTAAGAKVCIVGRRQNALDTVKSECLKGGADGKAILSVVGDFTNAEDMVRVRSEIQAAWEGFDTLIVSAGVSAVRPLLSLAGLEKPRDVKSTEQVTIENIHRTVDTVGLAMKGNFTGPLIAALTFIPLLQFSSRSPSILLVSSLAAALPAPTRSVYASTKAAALLLYQSLAIEHPAIAFTWIMPSTVQGNFRSTAVDLGDAPDLYKEAKVGLKQEAVAERCIQAVDAGEKHVFMPAPFCRSGQAMYWWIPWATEGIARRKYNFVA